MEASGGRARQDDNGTGVSEMLNPDQFFGRHGPSADLWASAARWQLGEFRRRATFRSWMRESPEAYSGMSNWSL